MYQTASLIFKMTLYHHSPCALTVQNSAPNCAFMRALFVIILLTALVLPSGGVSVSPPSDLSGADLQTLQTQVVQANLGVLYENGLGVPQDYGKARQWYEHAAPQGDANAQNNLGYLYVDGKGVPKDEKRGVEWIRKFKGC